MEEKSILQYLHEFGWAYSSPCGCRARMDKYVHESEKYKNHEIWVNKDGSFFEIRMKHDRTSTKITSGIASTLLNTFSNHFDSL